MKRVLLAGLLLVLLVAAGCGGDDEEASGAEAWADGFCSAAADWRSSIDDLVGQFANPAELSADSVSQAIDEGLDETESFLDEVRALGRPDTEAGQEVEEIVDSMASDVQSTVDDLRASFDDGDSLPELIGKVTQASGQLSQLQADLSSSLDQLEDVDTGELRDDLESNADCDAARSGS